jgi:Cu/Ag efflux protein CusF
MKYKTMLALLTAVATTGMAGSAMATEDRCSDAAAAGDPAVCDAGRATNQALLEDPINQPLSRGKVVAVDRAAGKITLEHRPIQHLYLEGGTTIFHVENPKTLLGLTPGDKVRFEAEREGKGYVLTRIENSN